LEAEARERETAERVDEVQGDGAEIVERTGVALAAEQQECRSDAGAWERDGGEGEDVGVSPTSAVGNSSPSDAVRLAERDERAATHRAGLADAARRLENQQEGVVTDAARVGSGNAANGLAMSNEERKRRRREERKRIRELCVV
jgi:hypothetical protein